MLLKTYINKETNKIALSCSTFTEGRFFLVLAILANLTADFPITFELKYICIITKFIASLHFKQFNMRENQHK